MIPAEVGRLLPNIDEIPYVANLTCWQMKGLGLISILVLRIERAKRVIAWCYLESKILY